MNKNSHLKRCNEEDNKDKWLQYTILTFLFAYKNNLDIIIEKERLFNKKKNDYLNNFYKFKNDKNELLNIINECKDLNIIKDHKEDENENNKLNIMEIRRFKNYYNSYYIKKLNINLDIYKSNKIIKDFIKIDISKYLKETYNIKLNLFLNSIDKLLKDLISNFKIKNRNERYLIIKNVEILYMINNLINKENEDENQNGKGNENDLINNQLYDLNSDDEIINEKDLFNNIIFNNNENFNLKFNFTKLINLNDDLINTLKNNKNIEINNDIINIKLKIN